LALCRSVGVRVERVAPARRHCCNHKFTLSTLNYVTENLFVPAQQVGPAVTLLCWPVQISTGKPATVTEVSRTLTQSHQENAGTEPRLGHGRSFYILSNHLPLFLAF
jgi:hypothetical protein